jgi:hypothetical protein
MIPWTGRTAPALSRILSVMFFARWQTCRSRAMAWTLLNRIRSPCSVRWYLRWRTCRSRILCVPAAAAAPSLTNMVGLSVAHFGLLPMMALHVAVSCYHRVTEDTSDARRGFDASSAYQSSLRTVAYLWSEAAKGRWVRIEFFGVSASCLGSEMHCISQLPAV